jgi:FkbM family methyltransferase
MSEPIELKILSGVHGRFLAYENDLITRQIEQFGAHTRNEIAFLCCAVEPGDRIIDLGAHIGTFTVPLARKAGPTGRVLAIEANLVTFSLLQVNMHLNELASRVQCLNTAVGVEGARAAAMTMSPGNSGSARFSFGEGAVRFSSLRRVMAANDIERPDVIKMDVEGMEGMILEDIAPMLAEVRPVLYFEVALTLKKNGTDPSELRARLASLGYRLFRNVGQRNSANDSFTVVEMDKMPEGDRIFDCLAIPRDSARVGQFAEAHPGTSR